MNAFESGKSASFPHPDTIDRSLSLQELLESYGVNAEDLKLLFGVMGFAPDNGMLMGITTFQYVRPLQEFGETTWGYLEAIFLVFHDFGIQKVLLNPHDYLSRESHARIKVHPSLRKKSDEISKNNDESYLRKSLTEMIEGFCTLSDVAAQFQGDQTYVSVLYAFQNLPLGEMKGQAPETFERVIQFLQSKNLLSSGQEEVEDRVRSQITGVMTRKAKRPKSPTDTLGGPDSGDLQKRLREMQQDQ